MVNEKLAILGGPKAIKTEFKKYNSIGTEELEAAIEDELASLLGLHENDINVILFS